MSDETGDLIARLQALSPEERALLLAALGGATAIQSPTAARDVNVATNQTIHNYGAGAGPAPVTQLGEYLRSLGGECNRLSLADADSSDPNRAAIELAAVYTGLEVATTVELSAQEQRNRSGEQHRRLTAIEILAGQDRLVLLGDPGSGKSTVLNFVGFCLARAWLGEAGWLERLGLAWPHAALLPVRVVLREFSAWVDALDDPPKRGEVGLLWRWLEVRGGCTPELVAAIREQVAAGRALLLLDGLDEVPRSALPLVRETLERLGSTAGASRVLVTCRILDYGERPRQLAGWPSEMIAPLSTELRQEFIGRWYDVLAAFERPLNGDPAELRARLQAAVRERPELRRLAGNPLLLTMMTLLHAYEGRLPDERVKLYEKCIEFLLLRWRPERGTQPLRELLKLPEWSESSDLGRLLDRLGFAAHERGVSGDGEAGADLPKDVLLASARQFFTNYGPDQDAIRAQTFLNYISAYSNGLLQQHMQEVYRFPHRTFQEYLAARRLVSDDDWPDAEAEFVDRALRRVDAGPQWREALLLAVSQQAVVGRQVRPTAQLAEELLTRHPQGTAAWARNAVLAGELLVEVGRARLGERYTGLWDRARAALVAMLGELDAQGEHLLPSDWRVRGGFALGQLGDPRYPVQIEQWREELAKALRGEKEGYFCHVPAGTYVIGSADDDPDAQDNEKPQHKYQLDQPIWIARLPITNDQWNAWVECGGDQQRYADDSNFNQPNQPVIGIQWYWACAYSEWLTTYLADMLPDSYELRLPAEFEWETSARGDNARRYPWGDVWLDDRAATKEDREVRGWSSSTPVGCYPAGAALCGALDLAGNVWEWMVNGWHLYSSTQKAFPENSFKALRGGSAWDNRNYVRCESRNWDYPGGRMSNLGFRVFVAPRLAHTS